MTARLEAVHPVLMVRDVPASIRFYRRLGFDLTFADSEVEPKYVGSVKRDAVELHLQWHDARDFSSGDRPTYRFLVPQVDDLSREFAARDSGLDRTKVWDTDWGTREFHVRAPVLPATLSLPRGAQRIHQEMITLREAGLSDLDVIYDIRRDAILGIKFEALSNRDLREWAERRSPEFFRDRLVANQVVVAVHQGNAVGWGSFLENRVTALYVRPAVRSRGIGRQVMSWLELRIKNDGYAFARLESSPNAVKFYKGLGYLEVGQAENRGAIPMKKDL